jgi:hypothetical protein
MGEASETAFPANKFTKFYPGWVASNKHPRGPSDLGVQARAYPLEGPAGAHTWIKATRFWCHYRRSLPNLPKPGVGRRGREGTE